MPPDRGSEAAEVLGAEVKVVGLPCRLEVDDRDTTRHVVAAKSSYGLRFAGVAATGMKLHDGTINHTAVITSDLDSFHFLM